MTDLTLDAGRVQHQIVHLSRQPSLLLPSTGVMEEALMKDGDEADIKCCVSV